MTTHFKELLRAGLSQIPVEGLQRILKYCETKPLLLSGAFSTSATGGVLC